MDEYTSTHQENEDERMDNVTAIKTMVNDEDLRLADNIERFASALVVARERMQRNIDASLARFTSNETSLLGTAEGQLNKAGENANGVVQLRSKSRRALPGEFFFFLFSLRHNAA